MIIASSVIADFSYIEGSEVTFGVKFLDEDNNLGLDTNVTVSYLVGDEPEVLANRVHDAVSTLAAGNDWDISGARFVVYAISGLPTFSPDAQTHTVLLSSVQLLALHNTPVQIVPAPSGDSYLAPVYISWTFHAGVTPYATVAGNFSVHHQGSAVELFGLAVRDVLVGDVDQANYSTSNSANPFSLSSALGKALVIDSFDALTDGDGTLEISTQYVIVRS